MSSEDTYWNDMISAQGEIEVLSCRMIIESSSDDSSCDDDSCDDDSCDDEYIEGSIVITPKTTVFLCMVDGIVKRVDYGRIIDIEFHENSDIFGVNVDLRMCNNLRSLTLDFCHAISDLDCRWCTELSFISAMNSSLTSIDCRKTPVVSLDLRGCENLTTVKASYCPLFELRLDNCPKLEQLDVSYTDLTELNLVGYESLTVVNCDWCRKLTSIDLTGCKSLKRVSCGLAKVKVDPGLDNVVHQAVE